MKKYLLFPLFALAMMCLTISCSDNNDDIDTGGDDGKEEPIVPGDGNILIAYFTNVEPCGTNTNGSASRVALDGELYGNTEFIANIIQEQTEGDIFAIRTATPYPANRDELLAQAREEKNNNARPQLTATVENMDQYDVIYIGYPNWNADLPMPVYTFLEGYDLSGKVICPFNVHGGSGLSSTVNTIRNLHPEATVTSGFTVSRNSVTGARNDVLRWLREIGAIEE